jgi:hypothetical protein
MSPIKLTQNINVFLVRIYSIIFIYKSTSTKPVLQIFADLNN